jgi:hypothetical protein
MVGSVRFYVGSGDQSGSSVFVMFFSVLGQTKLNRPETENHEKPKTKTEPTGYRVGSVLWARFGF